MVEKKKKRKENKTKKPPYILILSSVKTDALTTVKKNLKKKLKNIFGKQM